jgi:hypothetical protein
MSKHAAEEPEPQREGAIPPAARDNKTPGARSKRLRVVAWVAGSFLALAAVGALALGYFSYRAISNHPGLAGVGTTETTPIAIGLGGRSFEIPANYFYGPPEPGLNQRDILLRALWPTMDGRTSENHGHFRVGDFGQKIQMLLTDFRQYQVSAFEGLENRLNTRMENSGPLEARGMVYGLEHLVPVRKGHRSSRYEIFIQRAGGKPESFIACSPDGSVPFPICIHWFDIGKDIRAEVTYGKPYLREWRQIHQSVVALLDRFAGETAAKSDEHPSESDSK